MSEASTPIVAVDKDQREHRYQTKGLLGSGTFGTVYLAVRQPDGDDVSADDARLRAIKVAQSPRDMDRLLHEAEVLQAIQDEPHPFGVYRPVRIHSGDHPYKMQGPLGGALIELEYLDGPTLQQWFDQQWRPAERSPGEIADELLSIAREVGEALVQLHESRRALIHRDLKPDNLMRTSRGIRVFDFNVSREDDPERSLTSYVGTEGYMAPEIPTGTYDARADLYSLGVILWEVAHHRRLRQADVVRDGLRVTLRWPSTLVGDWPGPDREVLDQLLPALICHQDGRISSARALLRLVEDLEAPRRAARVDQLAELDMIQLLSELRPNGIAAVVSDSTGQVGNARLQGFLREAMQVEDPLEGWLAHEIERAATTDRTGPALFVLAGNAGDGKSHLLYRLRQRFAGRPEVLGRLRVIADATHALTPDASQMDRLAGFFRPFADPSSDAAGSRDGDKVHVIAMNTGMVIKFFEADEGAPYRQLYEILQHRLGLRRTRPEGTDPWPVEVMNLDLRDLLAPLQDGRSFAERMLDRLDPENAEGIAGLKWPTCRTCSAFALCPVAFNLRALREAQVREALLRILRRVALDTDVHLSPRNLWGFLYRLLTGGVERYDGYARDDHGPCDVVRRRTDAATEQDGAWLLTGHLTELLFQQEDAGTPWSALTRHDPAYSSAPAIDQLHTRLSIKTELDNDPSVVETQLGGTGRSLAGLALDALTSKLPKAGFRGRRRDAAVRRQVLFHRDTFEAWAAADGGRDFAALLEAYLDFSQRAGQLEDLQTETREQLRVLRKLVQEVFLRGNGRQVNGHDYLKVSQPNGRARTELLVRADSSALDRLFHLGQIVAPDVHVAAHQGREQLLKLLGYRPNQVTLTILGVRLTVDLTLYEFLQRVRDGLKPSARDLSQFQALLFLGDRVGNELARGHEAGELFVWDGDQATLLRLATDDFGIPRLEPAR